MPVVDSARLTDDYTSKLRGLTPHGLLKETENQIWHSAFASNSPGAEAHWKVDLCSAEARRRGETALYKVAYRLAMVNTGLADPHPEDGSLTKAEAAYSSS